MGDSKVRAELIQHLKVAWGSMESNFQDIEALLEDVEDLLQPVEDEEEEDEDDDFPVVRPPSYALLECLDTYIQRVRAHRELYVNPGMSPEAQQAVRQEALDAVLRIEEVLLRLRALA